MTLHNMHKRVNWQKVTVIASSVLLFIALLPIAIIVADAWYTAMKWLIAHFGESCKYR